MKAENEGPDPKSTIGQKGAAEILWRRTHGLVIELVGEDATAVEILLRMAKSAAGKRAGVCTAFHSEGQLTTLIGFGFTQEQVQRVLGPVTSFMNEVSNHQRRGVYYAFAERVEEEIQSRHM